MQEYRPRMNALGTQQTLRQRQRQTYRRVVESLARSQEYTANAQLERVDTSRRGIGEQNDLVARQRMSGEMAGSWDPVCVWGGYGGRVYSTALATLCLQVYYRYVPMYLETAESDGRSTSR